ncbi:MAG: HNH endonuclease [Atribacterota bacterium]
MGKWSEEIKKRDGYKCVICGKRAEKGRGKGLNTHHILPKEIKEFKEDIDNGITLCPKHHRYARKEVSAHQNSFAFSIFLKEFRPKQYFYLEKIVKERFINNKIYNMVNENKDNKKKTTFRGNKEKNKRKS